MISCGKLHKVWLSLAFAVVHGIGLNACAITHTSELKGEIKNPPNVQQVPVSVGVLYSPEFREYEHTIASGPHLFVIPIGEASVRIFDQVFPLMFQGVKPVSSRPPFPAEKGKLAAIIEPRIEEADFRHGGYSGYGAILTYLFTVYSLDGTPVASWTVKGEGYREWSFWDWSMSEPLGQAGDRALQDVAVKLLNGFRDVPEVKRWLEQTRVQDSH